MLSDITSVSLMMAVIVFFTRSIGYLIALRWQNIHQYKDILEALPGCAIMSLLFPSFLRGNIYEIGALLLTAGLMWISNSVALATISGLLVLILSS